MVEMNRLVLITPFLPNLTNEMVWLIHCDNSEFWQIPAQGEKIRLSAS